MHNSKCKMLNYHFILHFAFCIIKRPDLSGLFIKYFSNEGSFDLHRSFRAELLTAEAGDTGVSVYFCFSLYHFYCLCGTDIFADTATDTFVFFKGRTGAYRPLYNTEYKTAEKALAIENYTFFMSDIIVIGNMKFLHVSVDIKLGQALRTQPSFYSV